MRSVQSRLLYHVENMNNESRIGEFDSKLGIKMLGSSIYTTLLAQFLLLNDRINHVLTLYKNCLNKSSISLQRK
jgi:hypothetical protein